VFTFDGICSSPQKKGLPKGEYQCINDGQYSNYKMVHFFLQYARWTEIRSRSICFLGQPLWSFEHPITKRKLISTAEIDVREATSGSELQSCWTKFLKPLIFVLFITRQTDNFSFAPYFHSKETIVLQMYIYFFSSPVLE